MDPLLLPLSTSSSKNAASNSLPVLIPRIHSERGGFRHLSEQSLAEEIANPSSAAVPAEEQDDEPREDPLDRRKTLYDRAAEMIRLVGEAHNSALQAVDFISLLLSGSGGKGEQTISPLLKELIPIGSLGMEPIEIASDDSRRQITQVSKGWKMESFNSAADSLLKSATRLEEEISQETEYWEQVLAVKENGWTMCRLPREWHTLGVKFGFKDATPGFRRGGIAALRRKEGGMIALDRGLLSSQPKAVKVQILRNGQLTGTSASIPRTDGSVQGHILEGRNTIYDEELFFELTREARLLVNFGVQIRQDTVQFKYSEDRCIIISREPMEDVFPHPGPDSNLASSLLLILRLLLSHVHTKNRTARSSLPSAAEQALRPDPPPLLLRPILAYVSHSAHVQELSNFLDALFLPLRNAGLTFDISKTLYNPTDVSYLDTPEKLMNALTYTLESNFTITYPSSDNAQLTITITTSLSPPIQGTEYAIKMSGGISSASHIPAFTPRITLDEEVREVIERALNIDLVYMIERISVSSNVVSQPASSSNRETGRSEESESAWRVADPQSYTLTKSVCSSGSSDRKVAKMTVLASSGELSIHWTWLPEIKETSKHQWTMGWRSEEDKGDKTLKDVVLEAPL